MPDSKTGAKGIFLNEASAKILREFPRIAGNPYVIVGKKSGARLVNLQKPWRRLRAAANIGDARASMTSVTALPASPPVLE